VSLPNGTFTLLAVTDANSADIGGREGFAGRSNRQPSFLLGFAEVSVAGHAPANTRIPLSPMQRWPIRLHATRTAAQTGANANQPLQRMVSVLSTQTPMNGYGDRPAEDAGEDRLEITGRGFSWMSVQMNDRSLCVGSFTAGGANLAREPLNLGLGVAPVPMDLTLRDDCAKLTIELPSARAALPPGEETFYTIYVVPDFDTTTDVPPMTIHPSTGGTVTVDGLTPGSYHIYTFDRPVRLEYRNPAVMAALPTPGQAVTLSPGATSHLVLEVGGR
jgi:hypothetical protein